MWAIARFAALAAGLGILGVGHNGAHAQSVMPGVDDVANAIAAGTMRKWAGPRVDFPEPQPRPTDTSLRAESSLWPVAVHATSNVPERTIQHTLAALEFAYSALQTQGWEHPMPDGGRGNTTAFDLYLVKNAPAMAAAHTDARALWSYIDRASTFTVMRSDLPMHTLRSCVTYGYARAMLLALDPAESPSWRRETASYLSQIATGRFGCAEGLHAQQHNAAKGWLSKNPSREGGLLMTLLSQTHDGGSGEFIRDLWDLSSQRTWEGKGLRASPDMWMSIETALRLAGTPLLDSIPALSAERLLSTRIGDAKPPVMWETTLIGLPKRKGCPAAIGPYGSAYARVDTSSLKSTTVLQVWLRSEYGVKWSISAIRLNEKGDDLGHMSAITQPTNPKAYLPIEIDEQTKSIWLIVTNLSSRLPDEDTPDTNMRAFEITLDVAANPAN